MNRREYIASHSIDWDIENSPCGDCKYVDDCQYYKGGCPEEREYALRNADVYGY